MTNPDKQTEAPSPMGRITRNYSPGGFFSAERGGGFGRLSRKGRYSAFFLTVLMLVVVLISDTAVAADSKITPKIAVAGGYNDNVFFTAEDKVDSFILATRPGIAIDYQTNITSFLLTADFNILNYLDESDLNRTDQYYQLSMDHRPKERWKTSADMRFYRDTTLDSYLEETGRVFDRTERDFFEFYGNAGYNLTQVSSISAGYRFRYADYGSDRYSDNYRHSGHLDYSHRLKNEVDTLSIGPSYARRSNDFNEMDSFALNLGWARNWSTITRSRATLGAQYNTTKRNDGTKDDTWGVRAGLDITSRGLLSTTTFRYFHELRTTIEGNDVNVDNFFLTYRRPITERFGTAIEGRLVFSYKLFDQQTNVNDERYYWFEPRLFYQLTRDLDLSLRYRYRNNVEFRNDGDLKREINTIWLQLSYALPIPL